MSRTVPIAGEEVAAVLRRVAAVDRELAAIPRPMGTLHKGDLVDSLLCTSEDPHSSREMFDRLRWGGQVVCVTPDRHQAVRHSIQLANQGFEITQPVKSVSRRPWGLPIPLFGKQLWYFVARKLLLVQPGRITDRFTYHVHLEHGSAEGGEQAYVVVKEVPTLQQVTARLQSKWPELPDDVIEKRARKFADKIFPVFLTREAAILKIVNRDLPAEYRHRVPKLLKMEQDQNGYAQRLYLNWLRNGGEPISQLQFARQSADLLRVLHDEVGVMHLDLRLDNFVITPRGVGFVDFGSAVRVDEDLSKSPMLTSLFEELMHTSEIQRMLLKMTRSGQVTSQAICGGLHKVDKAVDYFYLAVQINSPHSNPELKSLIRYDKQSREAQMLAELTARILRPEDPSQPAVRSAADILRGIEQIEQALAQTQGSAAGA